MDLSWKEVPRMVVSEGVSNMSLSIPLPVRMRSLLSRMSGLLT